MSERPLNVRQELSHLKSLYHPHDIVRAANAINSYIADLEAENAKLRELLEAIVEDGSVASWWLNATKALLKDSPES